MKIFIDPGHGGSDSGAANGRRYEKNDVLALALQIKAYLDAQDSVETMLAREGDTQPTIRERADMANAWGADYYISIHRDAVGYSSANGCSAWVIDSALESTVSKAEKILSAVVEAGGFYDRGVRLGAANFTNYAVNTMTNMASVLVEFGFISSPKDNELFDEKFYEISEAVARALCEVVGLEYRQAETGDVNGDGKVTASDARAILRAAAGLEELQDKQAGDVDGDGRVTAADAREVLRRAAGLNEAQMGEGDE